MRAAWICGNRPGNYRFRTADGAALQGTSVAPYRLPAASTSNTYPIIDSTGEFPTPIMGLNRFCDWMWRIQSWTANVSLYALGQSFAWTVAGLRYVVGSSSPIEQGEEHKLGAAGGFIFDLDARTYGASAEVSGSISIGGSHQFHRDYFAEGVHGYRPLVVLRIVSDDSNLEIASGRPGTGTAIGTMLVAGLPVSIFKNVGPSDTAVGVSVEPAVWFEYRDQHGNRPIYDEDTGAELLNPFAQPPDWQGLAAADMPDLGDLTGARFVHGDGGDATLDATYAQ